MKEKEIQKQSFYKCPQCQKHYIQIGVMHKQDCKCKGILRD